MHVKFRLPKIAKTQWQPLLFYVLFLFAGGLILWWQLGDLTGGYTAGELQALHASNSLKHIFENPLNAPFTLLANAFMHISDYSLSVLRLTAAAFGLLTLSIFYWLVRYWHGERSAILGTIIFATSAWFLHTARLGTPDILLFLLLTFVACCLWVKHSARALPLFVAFFLAAALLYVPGMIWFVCIGVIWQWKRIDRLFKKQLWMVSLGALLLLVALAPLGLAMYHSPELAKQVIGLPAQGWPAPLVALRSLADVPVHLFVHGPVSPEHWLGQLPIFDAFATAMFALGAYVYVRHSGLERTRLVGVVLAVGSVLCALGGEVTLSLIVPFVYVLVAAGMGFMLSYWYKVFPRNVIAQSVGVAFICVAVLTAGWYNCRQYFVAWPNASATRLVFTVKQFSPSDTIKQ